MNTHLCQSQWNTFGPRNRKLMSFNFTVNLHKMCQCILAARLQSQTMSQDETKDGQSWWLWALMVRGTWISVNSPAGNNSHLLLGQCPRTLFSRAHLGQVSTWSAHWFTGKWICRDEDGNVALSFPLLPQLEKHMQEAASLWHSAIPTWHPPTLLDKCPEEKKKGCKIFPLLFWAPDFTACLYEGHIPLASQEPSLPPSPPPSHASQPLMECPSGLKPAFPRNDPSGNPGLSSTWADPENWFSCHQGKWHLNEIFKNPSLI